MHWQIPTAAPSIHKLDSLGLWYFFLKNNNAYSGKSLNNWVAVCDWHIQFWANWSQQISNLLLPIAINKQQQKRSIGH